MPNVHTLTVSFCLGLFAFGCNSAHTPGSTETGNPPVIDIGKVALVVSSDEVRIVGMPGAVTPGGAEVTVQAVGGDQVVTTKSAPDGSFEVKVDADAGVIEVHASAAGEESETVYVTQGGASVGTGDGGELSCKQRDELASQVVSNAVSTADASCQTAADCQKISTNTACRDTCGEFYIGKLAVAPIEAAVRAVDVDSRFCFGFEADGCVRTIPPCVPPQTGPIACVDGMCTHEAPPECPPNRRYVTDVCDACGMTGGCMTTTSRCAIVCSDSSACSEPGTSCSARGICEVVGCI